MELNWFEDAPIALVIDTSSLISEKFNFTSKKMKTVKNAIKKDDFYLLTTEIFRREFLKHSQHEAVGVLEKIRASGIPKFLASSEIEAVIEKLSIYNPEDFWKAYCKEFKAKDITTNIDWRKVFADYYEQRPPFSEKKKTEFPDAFNIKMIEAHKPKYIVIISSDPDYDDWSVKKKNLKLYKNFQEFTNEYVRIKDPEFTNITDDAINNCIAEIKKTLINDFIDTDHFDIDSFHSEINGVELTDMILRKLHITSINKKERFATYRLAFSATADLEISSTVTTYDSIDKEDVTLGYNSNSLEASLSIIVDVTMIIDNKNNGEFEIESTKVDSETIEIPHEWESFLAE